MPRPIILIPKDQVLTVHLSTAQEATAKELLAILRRIADTPETIHYLGHAALEICLSLEDLTHPDRLWSAGVLAADLTPQHDLGEHLSATRRHFGLIP